MLNNDESNILEAMQDNSIALVRAILMLGLSDRELMAISEHKKAPAGEAGAVGMWMII
jgi:hypothetical protein